eukprot:CAMPEP_0117665666 /NCGR_PEP_ID=MMETSP0804-20121206/9943_1 /TAXON_ID=1074897 /ORGANISM="Tetraselmis astigmatica, Strain CCMP880" /LENGTH=914 /DNA_ID=CAMNT_0005473117 /DNA_START=390 /DNA_END=3135 /DNA_ORIENTATION=+
MVHGGRAAAEMCSQCHATNTPWREGTLCNACWKKDHSLLLKVVKFLSNAQDRPGAWMSDTAVSREVAASRISMGFSAEELKGEIHRVVGIQAMFSKVADVQERQALDSSHGMEYRLLDSANCEVCLATDRDDEMILCDTCQLGWHMSCLQEPFKRDKVPDTKETWLCPKCSNASTTVPGNQQWVPNTAGPVEATTSRMGQITEEERSSHKEGCPVPGSRGEGGPSQVVCGAASGAVASQDPMAGTPTQRGTSTIGRPGSGWDEEDISDDSDSDGAFQRISGSSDCMEDCAELPGDVEVAGACVSGHPQSNLDGSDTCSRGRTPPPSAQPHTNTAVARGLHGEDQRKDGEELGPIEVAVTAARRPMKKQRTGEEEEEEGTGEADPAAAVLRAATALKSAGVLWLSARQCADKMAEQGFKFSDKGDRTAYVRYYLSGGHIHTRGRYLQIRDDSTVLFTPRAAFRCTACFACNSATLLVCNQCRHGWHLDCLSALAPWQPRDVAEWQCWECQCQGQVDPHNSGPEGQNTAQLQRNMGQNQRHHSPSPDVLPTKLPSHPASKQITRRPLSPQHRVAPAGSMNTDTVTEASHGMRASMKPAGAAAFSAMASINLATEELADGEKGRSRQESLAHNAKGQAQSIGNSPASRIGDVQKQSGRQTPTSVGGSPSGLVAAAPAEEDTTRSGRCHRRAAAGNASHDSPDRPCKSRGGDAGSAWQNMESPHMDGPKGDIPFSLGAADGNKSPGRQAESSVSHTFSQAGAATFTPQQTPQSYGHKSLAEDTSGRAEGPKSHTAIQLARGIVDGQQVVLNPSNLTDFWDQDRNSLLKWLSFTVAEEVCLDREETRRTIFALKLVDINPRGCLRLSEEQMGLLTELIRDIDWYNEAVKCQNPCADSLGQLIRVDLMKFLEAAKPAVHT